MILIPSLFHSPHSRKWWGKGFTRQAHQRHQTSRAFVVRHELLVLDSRANPARPMRNERTGQQANADESTATDGARVAGCDWMTHGAAGSSLLHQLASICRSGSFTAGF